MTATMNRRPPVSVVELKRAWHAVQAGQFRLSVRENSAERSRRQDGPTLERGAAVNHHDPCLDRRPPLLSADHPASRTDTPQ